MAPPCAAVETQLAWKSVTAQTLIRRLAQLRNEFRSFTSPASLVEQERERHSRDADTCGQAKRRRTLLRGLLACTASQSVTPCCQGGLAATCLGAAASSQHQPSPAPRKNLPTQRKPSAAPRQTLPTWSSRVAQVAPSTPLPVSATGLPPNSALRSLAGSWWGSGRSCPALRYTLHGRGGATSTGVVRQALS
jgi:hypothetical protein